MSHQRCTVPAATRRRCLRRPTKLHDVEQPVPVGAQDQVIHAGSAETEGDVLPLGRGGGGVPLPEGGAGLDLPLAPGLGVDQLDHPDIGQGQLPGVDDLDGQHLVAVGEAPQRPLPARGGQEVRDHDHEAPPPVAGTGQGPDSGGQVDRAVGAHPRGLRGGVQRPHEVATTGPGGQDLHTVGPGDEDAEAIAGAEGDEPDGGSGGEGQVPLLAAGRAEVEAGRPVEQHPGGQLPVGDRLADVDVGHAGGDVPVDPANVVAGGVGPGVTRLAAPAGDQALVLAVQHPVQAPGDVHLEATQHLLGGSPGDPRWCRPGSSGHVGRERGATDAAGTVDRTRTRTSLTSMPSARAS